LERYYDDFVHAGANLSEADKTEMRKLNEQISSLEDAFNTKLLAATKECAYATGDKAALAGLSEAQIAERRANGQGPQGGRFCRSTAEHDAAARSGFAQQSQHAASDV